MQRLVVVGVLWLLSIGIITMLVLNPRPKRELTWARAMVGAILVAGVALLVFGSLPTEWITYADSHLGWGRNDLVLINLPGFIPFDISKMAVRDMITAGVYTMNFAFALKLWVMWQQRYELAEQRAEKRAAPSGPVPAGTSSYGRPLSKQA